MKNCGCFARRRRLLRIVRNSLWLSLTHYATPPFPQKSRSARLLGCKRPPDGSLSLPTFADVRKRSVGRGLAPAVNIITNQRLQAIIFLYYIVGANCVRPLLICAEFDGRPQVAPTGCALSYRVGRGLAPAVILYQIFVISPSVIF